MSMVYREGGKFQGKSKEKRTNEKERGREREIRRARVKTHEMNAKKTIFIRKWCLYNMAFFRIETGER